MSVVSAIMSGFSIALQERGQGVEFRFLTYGTEDPFSVEEQYTSNSEYATGLFSRNTKADPKNRSIGIQQKTTLTVSQEDVSRRPDVGVVVVDDNSNRFTVTQVEDVAGVLYLMELAGKTGTGAVAADVQPPTLLTCDLTGGTTSIDIDATSDEGCYNRARYRRLSGSFITTSYSSGSYVTTIARTLAGLDAGVYEVHLQIKDAAENESKWQDCGEATVIGLPA